jgi:amino acid adenylation domain-containing protein
MRGSQRPVVTAIAKSASEYPNATALQSASGSMTYSALMTAAGLLASELADLGAGRDVPVGICISRSFEHVIALLATLQAGAAFVPLDPDWPIDRINSVLDDARAPMAIASPALAPKLSAANRTVLRSDQQRRQASRPLVADIEDESLAYIIYTSGSTGMPKGVEITHRNLRHLVNWHCEAFGISRNDRASCVAGLSFDALVWELFPYLAVGATVHLADEATRTSADQLREWLIGQAITVAFVPTPLAESMMRVDWPATTSLRTLLTGGDTLHVRPKAGLPFEVVNNYGPTECTVVATSGVVPPEGDQQALPAIGRPIAATQIHILDDDGQPAASGETGEIYISGANVGRGYRNQPALTAEEFLSGKIRPATEAERLFRTGDLGSWTADGQIAFHGRRDDQFKLRGYRIELDEITAALVRHPGVAHGVVDGQGDGPDKRLVAYVVPAGRQQIRAAELRAFLASTLPAYMLPAVFVRLASLPMTANGKVDRRALPKPTALNALSSAPYRAPESDVERHVATVVENLLGIEAVGVEDNFFLLGGHSLLATQLVVRVRDGLGVELTLRDVFEAQTIGNLATKVEQRLVDKVVSMSDDEVRTHLTL